MREGDGLDSEQVKRPSPWSDQHVRTFGVPAWMERICLLGGGASMGPKGRPCVLLGEQRAKQGIEADQRLPEEVLFQKLGALSCH